MIDQNTKEYREQNGKVAGIKLEIYKVPNQQYYVDTLSLIDENTARGKTIATFYVEGQGHKCFLGYPFTFDGKFQNKLSVGGTNNEHIISNGFSPNIDIGPLSIYVGDERGNCISEIVRGLGLPNRHHVSFVVGYKKVSSIPITPPDKPVETGDLQDRVTRLEKQMNILINTLELMQGEL